MGAANGLKRNPERKEDSMNKSNHAPVSAPRQLKATRESSYEYVDDIDPDGPSLTAAPTHQEIAKRAYEIYVQKGSQPGGCEQNWRQAEQELKK